MYKLQAAKSSLSEWIFECPVKLENCSFNLELTGLSFFAGPVECSVRFCSRFQMAHEPLEYLQQETPSDCAGHQKTYEVS